MTTFLLFAQIAISALFTGLILMQPKGTGFARGWSASTASFTRRGLEKVIFKFTFVVAGIFLLISVSTILL